MKKAESATKFRVKCCPDLIPIRKIALAFRELFATSDSAALHFTQSFEKHLLFRRDFLRLPGREDGGVFWMAPLMPPRGHVGGNHLARTLERINVLLLFPLSSVHKGQGQGSEISSSNRCGIGFGGGRQPLC